EIDALIIFNPASDMDIFALAKRAKEEKEGLPIVLLGRNTPELEHMAELNTGKAIDHIFTWSGDGKIFLSIIQFLESELPLQYDTSTSPTPKQTRTAQRILIVDHSPQFYSTFLFHAYEMVWEHMGHILGEDLTRPQELKRNERQPRVLIATTFEEAEMAYEQHKENLLCLITDTGRSLKPDLTPEPDPSHKPDLTPKTGEPKPGIQFAKKVKEEKPHIPILLLSTDPDDEESAIGLKEGFIRKGSSNYISKFRNFIRKSLGPLDLVFLEKGKEIARASDMETLEKALWAIPNQALSDHTENGMLTGWLSSRMEFELADEFSTLIGQEDGEELRKSLINALKRHKRAAHRGTVTKYSRKAYGARAKFSRIGGGAMGGKARGLAFMDKIISEHLD
ncbi:MAG: hypothetical protein KAT70_08830, partial [Thermoplasmata archaeon]|nr:hypothetical protein [Thermoplasmata archaeon]